MSVVERKRVDLSTDSWLRAFAESVEIGVFALQQRLLYVNPAFARLVGRRAEELEGGELGVLIPERFRHRILQRVEERLEGSGGRAQFKMPLLRADGEERWVHVHLTYLELGGAPFLAGTATDVTDRLTDLRSLRESERWFRTLADTTAIAIFVYDEERLFYTNRAAQELAGYDADELHEMSPTDLVHPEDLERVRERIERRRQGEEVSGRTELKMVTKDGSVRWLDVGGGTLEVEGRLVVLGSAVDITERVETQNALRRETERAEVTLAAIGDAVIRTDVQGRIDYLNPVASRLIGWTREAAVGRRLGEVFQVLDELSRRPLPDPVARCLETRELVEQPGPVLLVRRDGTEFAVRDTVAPLKDPDGSPSGVVRVFKDVTRLRGLERRMSYLARHDPLTGLLNRSEIERRVQEGLVACREDDRRHALLQLDLEGFKLVNETAGHVAGDEMLRQIARILREGVRDWDSVARLGSDEFAVLLLDVPRGEARRLAQSLHREAEELRLPWQDRILRVGVSVGLVFLDADSSNLQEVLRAADAACHVAKERGRNRIHEYRPDDTAIAERSGTLQWVHRLHKALEEDGLRLVRQVIRPLGDEGEGEAPFHEALLRLCGRRNDTWVPSRAFMPAAERYRLAPILDRWVVRRALPLLGEEERGTVALNLSGQSLSDETFLEDVEAALDDSRIDPGRVCFEITETAAIGHLTQATRFISALRERGCRFVLDDFGSGLSSFAYLKNLQVDFLKIDRSFVQEMVESRVQRALVSSMHQLGREIEIATIAEGVETKATFEALKEIGVDYVQGYWVGRPERWG